MTIFDVIKAIKKGTMYNIPISAFNEKRSLNDHYITSSYLVELRNKLVKQEYKVSFEMEKAVDVPVYDTDLKKMISTPVVKINIKVEKEK